MKTDFSGPARKAPPKFKAEPFAYHQEIEIEISSLTNLGEGVGRIGLDTGESWVVFVAGALPGERVLASVWHNSKHFSRADLIRVLKASPQRVEPQCPLFGRCGGCQYQNLSYAAQLEWKTRQIEELLTRIGKIDLPAGTLKPCFASPKQWAYRSKITPHFERPRQGEENFPIGFLAAGSARKIIDVPACPIATEAINRALPAVRDGARAKMARGEFKRGATLLLRETLEGVVTDHKSRVSERVGDLTLHFVAGDFFQNNPFILPDFVRFGVEAARGNGDCRFLVDTYCGSGLFALSAAKSFERVLGVEVSEDAVVNARENARGNGIGNCEFVAGSSEIIFAQVPFPPDQCAVIMDPPRKGSDEAFLTQLLDFAPKRIVYVSCGPDTQARDLQFLLASGKYALKTVQPFDLFPQTRHIENVAVLERISSRDWICTGQLSGIKSHMQLTQTSSTTDGVVG
ncbi:MAG: class I SAM-dependent RNA methyltransferase [Opitutales bacterium]|nr:class I SAM-dependent RNA methyltransferase [Opitutales bacterium]